ncbi:cell wall-binding repeat-containing protein [Microcella sp.]|uniref:cell wall-binding repeat-containing protein n=1 Tax=Microcella sp. TaxID=1913979 RepID=UPI002565FFA2|nr:cell wall-binding repeat-containing protein [Microcella sp.]MBX9472747.1 cell wall-binding repeat-containing protein [Microcella sp.]
MGVLRSAVVVVLAALLSGGALVDPAPDGEVPAVEAPEVEVPAVEVPAVDEPVAETPDENARTVENDPLAASAATAADRISGGDRYATAVAVSTQAFSSGADIVFLASGTDYPDALSSAPVAAALNGPLLLTSTNTLPAVVAAELDRLNPAQIIIVGGTGVVGSAVEQAARAFAPEVRRVFGADRYETSRALITEFAPPSDTLYLATGRNYPDALAAAAAAGSQGAPVLLVDGLTSTPTSQTLALIAARSVQTVLVAGGTGVISSELAMALDAQVDQVQRLAGLDRYSTAVAINAYAFETAERAFVATGAGYADALSGAVLAAVEGAPLYLSSPTCLPRTAREAMIDTLQVDRVTLLGGEGVLSARVAALDECSTIADDRATSIAELVAALNLRLRSLAGSYSVSVRELGNLETVVSINGAVMQEPASVMKLFVAYAILDRVDRGLLSLTTPTRSGVSVQECLRVILHVSDNYCHWDLVALIGNQALNDQFWAEGYTRTVYQGTSGNGAYYSSKHTSTNDVTLLLTRLHRGELLSPELTDYFIELLETQVWRHRLPAGMPPGIPIANKTGYLWVGSGYIHADVAIVSAPTGPFVVSVIGSRNATAAGVRAIGTVVYEHFAGPVTSTAAYSSLNLVTTRSVAYYQYAGNTQLGVIPAGTRVEAYASARDWYQVGYGGRYVYIHSSSLRNYFDYPQR